MNVDELYDLTEWMAESGHELQPKFQALGNVLQHNATQPQKQPVADPLSDLLDSILGVPLDELTNEQSELLNDLNVLHLFGQAGADFVRNLITQGDYDPATTTAEFQKSVQDLNSAISGLQEINSSLSRYERLISKPEAPSDYVTIRIQFKEGASIDDVSGWKRWSNDWHEIIRGVALCVGEAPENTKVVGAANGSLVMILCGTIAFTGALALITKHLSSIIMHGLQIANAIESLRHQKLLNKTIENNLRKQSEKAASEGVKTILAETEKALPNPIDGEQRQALERAIKKYYDFNDLGGNVDFVNPPSDIESESADRVDEDVMDAEQIEEIRKNIKEVRMLREQVKLITQQATEGVSEK